jgi:hypothetical protein
MYWRRKMDWTKIPTTIISKRYSDYEILSIVKFQLVWAMNEEQPDKTTALRYMTAKQYETAMTYLDSISATVSDEVSLVTRKRSAEKIRYSKNKGLSKNLQADCKQTVNSMQEQIREDKIKEEKEIYKEKFEEWWSYFPKQRAGSKQKTYLKYKKAIKEEKLTPEFLLEKVKEYANSREVASGYACGGERYFNDCKYNNLYATSATSIKEESGWHVEGSNW